MKSRAALWLALAACSNLTTTEGGVASITVEVPSPAEVEVSGTVQLHAVARGADGEELDAPIYWRVLDTTVAVDSVEGILTGVTVGKTGRVVARALDLYSREVSFTVVPRADTLFVVGDSVVTVDPGDDESPPLQVRVQAGDPRATVTGRRVTYEVISPAFATPEDRTVEFSNGQLAQNVTTSSTTLLRRDGKTAPDTAVVRVSVYRPGGGTVPGSGHHFLVLFPR